MYKESKRHYLRNRYEFIKTLNVKLVCAYKKIERSKIKSILTSCWHNDELTSPLTTHRNVIKDIYLL